MVSGGEKSQSHRSPFGAAVFHQAKQTSAQRRSPSARRPGPGAEPGVGGGARWSQARLACPDWTHCCSFSFFPMFQLFFGSSPLATSTPPRRTRFSKINFTQNSVKVHEYRKYIKSKHKLLLCFFYHLKALIIRASSRYFSDNYECKKRTARDYTSY